MKILPSSIRERKRYIVFEILSEHEIDRRELIKEMWTSAYSLFGDVGTSKLGLWMLAFDGKRGIIRCSRNKTEEVRAVLAAIDGVYGRPIGATVLRICGTINGAKHFIKNDSNRH
ncbi:MAG: Rpp14/Pop5 family protein [Halobacteriota archaeon]|nr:Rpp14/Pop5 family protein [Halobacteriota archaeon]